MIVAMLRRHAWILLALALFAAWNWWRGAEPVATPPGDSHGAHVPRTSREMVPPATHRAGSLPPQAQATLERILAGGPHPYRQDGGIFQNRERLLPQRERGWYREYTVDTPGSRDRGAHRIVTGGQPPREFWYTADHYRSFRRIDAAVERMP